MGRRGIERAFKKVSLSSFVLKVAALLCMTADHLGYMLDMYDAPFALVYVLRSFGRLALPLFCFMVVEGVFHTRSFGKYVLRLGVVGVAVLAAQVFMEYVMEFGLYQGNIFLDLILGALLVKMLSGNKIRQKAIAAFIVLALFAAYIEFCYEAAGHDKLMTPPYYLRPQYPLHSTVYIICFYFARKLAFGLTKAEAGDDVAALKQRMIANVFAAVAVTVASAINFITEYSLENGLIAGLEAQFEFYQQTFSACSAALILLYSGKRGYNKKWFYYGQYLYYPLHILIIFGLITALLS